MKQGRLGIVYLALETSLPANKKLPHTPSTPDPTPTTTTPAPTPTTPMTPVTHAPTGRRILSKDQAEGWTGVFETEYME